MEGYRRENRVKRASPKPKFNLIESKYSNYAQQFLNNSDLINSLHINRVNPYQKIKSKFNFIQSPIIAKSSKLVEKSKSISPQMASNSTN